MAVVNELWASLLISAAFAAVVIVLCTRAIERFGGIVGGVLGTMPSTILVASYGFHSQLSADDFAIAMYTAPIGVLAASLGLIVWRVVPQRLDQTRSVGRNLVIVVAVALLVWAVLAGLIYIANRFAVDGSVPRARAGGWAAVGITVVVGLAACFHQVDAPKGKKPVTWVVLGLRGLACAAVIALGVYLGTLSPAVGALVATFPVIFLTTMVSLWLSQGQAVPVGATGPMMLGVTAVEVYACVLPNVAPLWPYGAASVFSFAVAVLGISLPVVLFLQSRRARVVADHQHVQQHDSQPRPMSLDIRDPILISSANGKVVISF